MLIIEDISHPSMVAEPRNQSKEYRIGTEIWEKLEIGQSTLLTEVRPRDIKSRLKRLNDSLPAHVPKREYRYTTQLKKDSVRYYRVK